jgi:putative RNA 2'-phosphotransferase
MDYVKLSKEISYALRHAPWEYELELDSDGFVKIDQLLDSLNSSKKHERNITKEDLKHIIEISDKKRHEIVDDKIRALYGHSIPNKIAKEIALPPDILYHGTAHKFIESIFQKGLLPKNRQYVHLSKDIETAMLVGKRRDSNPVILEIDAKSASNDRVVFYIGNDKVFLCDALPPKYIKIMKQ